MIFTLYTYYRRASMVFERQAALIREEGSQQAGLLQQGQQGTALARLLSRKRLNELASQLGRTNAQAQEFAELAAECQNRTRILERELLGVDMYLDGELLEAM